MNDPRATFERAKADLAQLRDEMKVKLNLAKKDAADAWQTLEPTLHKAEALFEEAAHDFKTSWPGVDKAVQQVVTDAKKAAADAKAEVDAAQLKETAKKAADEIKASVLDLRKRLGL